MRWTSLWCLLLLASLVGADDASAQRRRRAAPATPPGVEVSVTPAPASLSPFRYILALRTTSWSSAEVVADRRLLSFVVHPEGRGRRHTCRHPDAPRRVVDARIRTLGAGSEEPEHREWIDLRMYCWGRALTALRQGARLEVRYGFGRRGRGLWVARPGGAPGDVSTASPNAVRSLDGGELAFAAVGEGDAEPTTEAEETPALISVSMPSRDVRTGRGLVFSPRLRATAGRHRVYVRDDLFRYRIRGPLGEAECALERVPIAPIVDFYRRISPRLAAGGALAISLACPDAFQVAGVYEVTPIVDLVYDAAQWDLDDVATGTFEGEPVPIRVRSGERGYVEQVPGTDAAIDAGGES